MVETMHPVLVYAPPKGGNVAADNLDDRDTLSEFLWQWWEHFTRVIWDMMPPGQRATAEATARAKAEAAATATSTAKAKADAAKAAAAAKADAAAAAAKAAAAAAALAKKQCYGVTGSRSTWLRAESRGTQYCYPEGYGSGRHYPDTTKRCWHSGPNRVPWPNCAD
jgi:hypothetical protein